MRKMFFSAESATETHSHTKRCHVTCLDTS